MDSIYVIVVLGVALMVAVVAIRSTTWWANASTRIAIFSKSGEVSLAYLVIAYVAGYLVFVPPATWLATTFISPIFSEKPVLGSILLISLGGLVALLANSSSLLLIRQIALLKDNK